MAENEGDMNHEVPHTVCTATNGQRTSICSRSLIGFFLLGLCTHLPYALMTTAANTIAQSFDASSFVATVYGAGNGATVVIKNINAFLLFRVSYGARFLANSVIMLSGISGLAFSQSFPLAILSIVLIGASNAFGENIALGYLSRFDSRHVTAWASGYGLAGLLGAILYVLFGCLINKDDDSKDRRNLDKWVFISIVPVVIVYLTASLQLIKEPGILSVCNAARHRQDARTDDQTTPLLKNTRDILRVQQESHLSETSSSVNGLTVNDTLSDLDSNDNIHLPLAGKIKALLHQVKRCSKLVSWLAFNLAMIQFTSYTIRVAAAKARHKDDVTSCPELYASLQLCFQAGVFASQSSLPIGKIRQVGLLTTVQTVNMLLWVINDGFKFLPVALLPALMIVSGVLQGTVYVNVFYMIRTDTKFPDEDKEMCANVAAIFLTVGLSFSCILQTILFNTVLLPY